MAQPPLPGPTERLLFLNGVAIIENLIRRQNGGVVNEDMVRSIIARFNDAYLQDLPIPPSRRQLEWPQNPEHRNFRFFARYHISRLLGWTERREEGQADGYEEEFNNLIRSYWSDLHPDHPQHPPQQVCITCRKTSGTLFAFIVLGINFQHCTNCTILEGLAMCRKFLELC
jgi:hypothetical protein